MLPLVASAKKSNSGSKCLGPARLTTYLWFSTLKSLTGKNLTITFHSNHQRVSQNVSAYPKMYFLLHIITTSSRNSRVSMINTVRNDEKAVFTDIFKILKILKNFYIFLRWWEGIKTACTMSTFISRFCWILFCSFLFVCFVFVLFFLLFFFSVFSVFFMMRACLLYESSRGNQVDGLPRAPHLWKWSAVFYFSRNPTVQMTSR